MKRLRTLLLSFTLSLVALQVFAGCDDVVVDEVGLFGDDIARVQEAASALENLGAVVRVRTVSDFGSAGNIDRYEDALEKSCPGWRTPRGDGTRSALLVLIVEVKHRESGIYYGRQWQPVIDGRVDHILNNVLNPRLGDGDFVGAFTSSLDEIARTIQADRAPKSVPVQATTPIIISQPAQPSAPADLSGLWNVMGWGLGLLVAGLLVWWLVGIANAHKRRRELERAAQQRANANKTLCSNLISGSFESGLAVTAARISQVGKLVSREDISPLQEELRDITAGWQALIADFSRLDETPGIDPSISGKSVAEYEHSESVYDDLLKKLKRVIAEKNVLDGGIEELGRMANEVPSQIESSRALVATSKISVAEISALGFKTIEADATLIEAEQRLTDAVDLAGRKQFSAAKAAANEVSRLAEMAVTEAQEIKKTHETLVGRRQDFLVMCDELDRRADLVHGTFEALSSYRESSWSSVVGNGTEAENRVATARETLEEVGAALAMDRQDFAVAKQGLSEVLEWLGEADNLLSAITNTYESLKSAQTKAPAEIEMARNDIEGARQFVAKNREMIGSSHDRELDDAEAILEQARQGLAEEMPDFVAVVKLALRANSVADAVYARANTEHEAMLRKIARSKSLLEEADRSVRAAESYIRNHSSDVNASAKAELAEASRLLVSARSTRDLDSIIRYAGDSDSRADSALARAKRDVAEEESRRRRVAEAAEAAARAARQRSSSGGGFSSGRSGSSSSWGSSSRGGSSSSWGSSSRGGRSGKW